MDITLIAAMGSNRVIGANNALIWHLPADLKFFKEKTTGHHIIMGRKTYESVGKPLPNRTNIVITTQANYVAEGCTVVNSLAEAIAAVAPTETEAFVVGGAQIYREALAVATHIYLTEIEAAFEGDAHFPEFDLSQWQEVWSEHRPADEKNQYAMRFIRYQKL